MRGHGPERLLSSLSYGTAVPMSWDQLEAVARRRHSSGSSLADQVKTYVFDRLTQTRAQVLVERVFGCLKESKSSFTLGPTTQEPSSGRRRVSLPAVATPVLRACEQKKVQVPADESAPAPKAPEKAPVDPEDLVFYSSVRGTVIHIRAPGDAWVKLCDSRSAKSRQPPLGVEQVIPFGGYTNAQKQERRFCTECLVRARV